MTSRRFRAMKEPEWRVLVIDDEEGIRKVISIALEDAGYRVSTAPEGETGLKVCRELDPQIVVTDVRMPGLDGIEVLTRVREEDPKREVIVITAFGDMDLAVRALQLNASDFILKPLHSDALLVALERAKTRYRNRKALDDYTTLLEERWMDTAEELARTFDFQKNLIESSIDGILGCDRSGKVVTYNRSMEKMLGFPKKEVLGKMSLDRFFPEDSLAAFKEALSSEHYGGMNRLTLFESYLLSKTVEKVPVQLSATVLLEDGEEIGIVGFFKDLREIRQLEQQFADQARLLHQDRMMSLGRLAASVVHEINNPLSGILNYVRLMIKIVGRGTLSPDQMEKFQQYLTLVESETDRCSRIVSNLLAFSRKSGMNVAEVDLNELVQKCTLLTQHRMALQKIRLQARMDPATPKIMGEFNQIQQCVVNLIFNAIDAMPDGGRLTLETVLNSEKGVAEIRVTDTGRGIPMDILPHIFEPFFTTKTEGKGLGLGLSTVYGIVERHKGTITAESEPGKGALFVIRLPVRRSE
jgi:PAS domain S-box-containing protein